MTLLVLHSMALALPTTLPNAFPRAPIKTNASVATSQCSSQVSGMQCGGRGYTGLTCCASGFYCDESNPYWFGCKEGSAPSPPPPPPPYSPRMPVDLTAGSFLASTTNFGFGDTTACGCDSPTSMVEKLAQISTGPWYGAATPVWLGAPYAGTADEYNCAACSGGQCNDAITQGWASGKSFNNCAEGAGGCGKCFRLTVADEPNIYGVNIYDPSQPKVANVVVIDNCEMNNQYGNNQQWCVPFTNAPIKGCTLAEGSDNSTSCAPTTCSSTGDELTEVAGKWDASGHWDYSECGSADAFGCTNAAGYAGHVDVALTALPSSYALPWKTGDNPIVEVERVTCPDEVQTLLAGSQGMCKDAGIGCDTSKWFA